MRYEPHGYQTFATGYILSHPTSAIFLDCGLGKTVITLTAIFDLMLDSFLVHKVLVIAPLRVARDTWPDELAKWDHLSGMAMSVAVGTEAERKTAFSRRAHVYVINRENIDWLVNKSGVAFDFDMVVVDELSSFKSHQAKRFKSLMKVRPQVSRIVGLTGTPSANGLIDLWAEFRLLDMGARLGRFIGQYRQRFFEPDKRNAQVIFSYKPKPGAEEEIYRLISDITISMKATDHLAMPELVESEVTVRMGAAEAAKYKAMCDDLVVSLDGGDIDAANAAALSGKLQQMANGAVYGEGNKAVGLHSRKLDVLEDLVEAANGKPLLVAYWFKHDLTRILKRIPEATVLDDAASIREWNAGRIPVALIHPASAGHGLNLQAGGSTIVWFSLTWSLELYRQTVARLHRQGQ
jgi:SNF2 family DNA or RNA helicase